MKYESTQYNYSIECPSIADLCAAVGEKRVLNFVMSQVAAHRVNSWFRDGKDMAVDGKVYPLGDIFPGQGGSRTRREASSASIRP